MQDECWKHNRTSLDDGNVCELINKVTLQRLQDDEVSKICVDEKMCPDKEKELKEKAEKEQKERENEYKRKQEEEERKKNEEIENIKSEASRVEYEKRKEQDAKKLAEQRRIAHVNSGTGDTEYVVDEVGKAEDDKNDYLDRSSEKADHGDRKNETQVEVLASIENSSVIKKPDSPAKSLNSEGTKSPEATTRSTTPVSLDVVNIAPGRISGVASIAPSGRMFVDRTVELRLDVSDLRKR
ncbi:hypothetical protein Y032_0015g2571 [Ancylostoma ceylanicum]|uniref:Uncharacterized protein n=1 Tax=Ancylostoma ceylanicum TaxID=53326 RepID=A0A016V8D7_9BILA|nr:hypothetical protein Y032_0015g2571 [Ancylostoma ceylanicum]